MKRINIIVPIVFVLVVGALLTLLKPGGTETIQSKFLGILSPFLKTGSSVQKRVSALHENLKTLDELEIENKALRIKNRELQAVNQTLRGAEQESNKLRQALGYRKRSLFKLIPAHIVVRDAATWWSTVKINKGFDDGLKPDMPVLTENGMVGKTTTVAAHMATLLLISDENCKIAAKVEGTREQGIMSGGRASNTFMPEISLNFLSKNAQLKSGQKVYSSGVGGVFPGGVLLGVIHQYKSGVLAGRATVIPAVDLSTIEDVFVVAGKKQ